MVAKAAIFYCIYYVCGKIEAVNEKSHMQYDAAVTYPITEPKRSPIKKIMVILAIVIVLGGLAFLLVGYINKKHVDGISDALDSYVGVLKGNTGSEYPAIEVNLASTYEERQNYFNSLLSADEYRKLIGM